MLRVHLFSAAAVITISVKSKSPAFAEMTGEQRRFQNASSPSAMTGAEPEVMLERRLPVSGRILAM
jgi:hypothetical protein